MSWGLGAPSLFGQTGTSNLQRRNLNLISFPLKPTHFQGHLRGTQRRRPTSEELGECQRGLREVLVGSLRMGLVLLWVSVNTEPPQSPKPPSPKILISTQIFQTFLCEECSLNHMRILCMVLGAFFHQGVLEDQYQYCGPIFLISAIVSSTPQIDLKMILVVTYRARYLRIIKVGTLTASMPLTST